MAKKILDPNAVSALLAKGKQEAANVAHAKDVPAATIQPPVTVATQAKPATKKTEKRYLTLSVTAELHDALYDYQLEYRRSNPSKKGLHPGIGGATEQLLRQALKLPPLEATNHANT
jgi:hypothetical protein